MHLFCYLFRKDESVEHVFALKCRQAAHDETIVNAVEVAAVANVVANVVAIAVATAVVVAEPEGGVIVIGMLNFVSIERILSRN